MKKIIFIFLFLPLLSFAQLTKSGFLQTNPNLNVDWSGKIGGGKGLERFGKKNIFTFICGNNLTIMHITTNGVAPENKTVTYGTVSSSLSGSQKCWITQNLGAANQAVSETDATEAAAGWYWQFNKKKGYKNNGTITSPSFPTISTTGAVNWEATKDPCTLELGAGWRIPTVTEWTNVNSTNLRAQAYAGALKMHAAGYITQGSSTTLTERGSKFFYWSSTSSDANFGRALVIYTTSTYNQISGNDKDAGLSIRCIRD